MHLTLIINNNLSSIELKLHVNADTHVGLHKMDADASCTDLLGKSWGFRRSTIARREFLEAVCSVDDSSGDPDLRTRRGRSRGRGRGRVRGKRAAEAGVGFTAAKRGRRGRGRACVHADESSSAHNTGGTASDRAEDSDDLNLQEIRRRALARRMRGIIHGEKDTAQSDDMEEQECVEQSDDAEGEKQGLFTEREAADTLNTVGDQRNNKLKNHSEDQEENCISDKHEEDIQDAVCGTCGQREINRLMISCKSCGEFRHVDCVGVSETWKNEEYICPSCTDNQELPWRNQKTDDLCIKQEISSINRGDVEQMIKVEQNVEAVSPKCIGPGCSSDALPESVYCGHRCIVQHAAVAIKTLSEPKTEVKSAAVPAELSLKSEKRSFLAKLFKVKVNKSPAEGEQEVKAEEKSKDSVCSSAVTDPAQTTTATPPVHHKLTVKDSSEVEPALLCLKSPLSSLLQDVPCSEKAPAAPLLKKYTPARAKKTMPGSPRLELLKGALSKSPLASLKKPSDSSRASEVFVEAPEVSNGAPEVSVRAPEMSSRPPEVSVRAPEISSRAPDVPVTAPKVSVRAPEVSRGVPEMSSESPEVSVWDPHCSPLLIRQNIRCLLTKIILKRLNQSDGLIFSENDIEKFAVDLEKEMFSMCYTTDQEYRSKCQDLSLSLKDPKNKELCLQVLRGNLPVSRLISVSQQDIVEETSADPELEISSKEESSFLSVDIEEEATPPPAERVNAVESMNADTHPEEKSSPSTLKQTEEREINSDSPDMISSMLKDTTAEHKLHFFDLKCRICTGQASTDGDCETKKPKMKTETVEKESSSCVVQLTNEALDSNVLESPASPSAEDVDSKTHTVDYSPVVIPAVPLVSISGRDPRTAQYQKTPSSSVPESVSTSLQHPNPARNATETVNETQPTPVSVRLPKSILMKPSPSSLDASYGPNTRLADCDKGTRQFLSKQCILWKGFLNMPTVAKFVTKGYLISGSPDILKEELPDTIHIGGRILPQTVWEYVDLIKTSEAKELSLIRFHPASEEEEVAYVSLFSYFNSRRRFGVVSNICKHIKDLYLIPLCTKQSIPAALLPIEGPGLEQDHPNLIIGLAVCQKLKRPDGPPQDAAEKKFKSLIYKESSTPTSINDIGPHHTKADVFLNSNSSGSPSLPVSKPSQFVDMGTSKDSTTPLQTILNTLFGQKMPLSEITECKKTEDVQQKQEDAVRLVDDMPYDPEDYDPAVSNEAMVCLSPPKAVEPKVPPSAIKDEDDDDRPYDPEEEYCAIDHGETLRSNLPKVSEAKSVENPPTATTDIAYDPEDETVFEEMQSYLTNNAIPHKSTVCLSKYKEDISTATLSEQQKILEELNRQIEEQKRQLEEQTETLRLQKEAIGVSMAHFSVSDALMSPPTQFGGDETGMETTAYFSMNIQNKDPRICRKASQDVSFDDAEGEGIKKSAQKQLITEDTKNVASNKSVIPKEEMLEVESRQQTTKSSHSEKKGGSRRSTLSSRTKPRHEHRSHHHEKSSSRASHTDRPSKDVSDKHYTRRTTTERLSRGSYGDRKRVSSSASSRKSHHHHHHRDSPSRYSRRSHSTSNSHSKQRDKSGQDNTEESGNIGQQESGALLENSTQSDSISVQTPYVKVQSKTTKPKDKQLGEDQQDGILTTTHKAQQNQALQTFQNSPQPQQKLFDEKQAQLMPCKTDVSSKQASLGNNAHGDTPHRLTSALKPHKIQPDVFHYDSTNPSTHNLTVFPEPGQIDHKRSIASAQRLNYDLTHQSPSGDFPFHSQYRNVSQFDYDKLYSREIPQDFIKDPEHDQSCVAHKQDGLPRRIRRRFSLEHTEQSQQPRPNHLHESSFQTTETTTLPHKQSSLSCMQEQKVDQDESGQFPQGKLLLLGRKDFFRPPNAFDEWKPLREPSFKTKDSSAHASPQYTSETQSCNQTFGEEEKDPIQTCFSRQAPTHSRDPNCGSMHRPFEAQQYIERALRKSEFRGLRRGIRGTFFGRGPKMNAQPRFESPQQFLGQRGELPADLEASRPPNHHSFVSHNEAHSPGFPINAPTLFKRTHLNQCEVQTLGQPRKMFPNHHRLMNTRPLRRSGPLLPTPPGGPVSVSRVQRCNSPNEGHREYLP